MDGFVNGFGITGAPWRLDEMEERKSGELVIYGADREVVRIQVDRDYHPGRDLTSTAYQDAYTIASLPDLLKTLQIITLDAQNALSRPGLTTPERLALQTIMENAASALMRATAPNVLKKIVG